jgi:hypothetical protein
MSSKGRTSIERIKYKMPDVIRLKNKIIARKGKIAENIDLQIYLQQRSCGMEPIQSELIYHSLANSLLPMAVASVDQIIEHLQEQLSALE